MEKRLEKWGRRYVEMGFSVIPLKPQGKTPIIDWKTYQNQIATNDERTQWFGGDSRNNIGIVTGKLSGIVVADLDSPEALRFAEEQGFPATPTVETGKGFHLYFAYPRDRDVRNFQKRDDLPGIDLRGDGGYVVAPPSVHSSGRVYKWVDGKRIGELPLADLPTILLAEKPSDRTPIRDIYRGVSEGRRNESLVRIVGSLVNDGLPLEECVKFALIWNERNQPSLPKEEVERTVKGIYRRHQEQKSVSQFKTSVYNRKSKKLDLDSFDPVTVLRRGREIQDLDIEVRWLVDKLLPEQSITLLHGKGGIGKTWFTMQLADAVSRGTPFMGLTTRQSPVYYVDFENSLAVVVQRLRKLCVDDAEFWHNSFDPAPPRIDTEGWEAYKKCAPGLLIIDSLRAFHGMDENSSQDMALLMFRLKELRDMGFTILLLHHSPKGNARIYKGSTAILDLSDHVLSMHKVKGVDSEEETDEAESSIYYIGTKEKTRYEPFRFYVTFDEERSFIPAPDPQEEDLRALTVVIREMQQTAGAAPNQLTVVKAAKERLGFTPGKSRALLKKGENTHWTAERPGTNNQLCYSAVFQSVGTIGERKTEKLPADTGRDDVQEKGAPRNRPMDVNSQVTPPPSVGAIRRRRPNPTGDVEDGTPLQLVVLPDRAAAQEINQTANRAGNEDSKKNASLVLSIRRRRRPGDKKVGE